jgi:hypothetical protein
VIQLNALVDSPTKENSMGRKQVKKRKPVQRRQSDGSYETVYEDVVEWVTDNSSDSSSSDSSSD